MNEIVECRSDYEYAQQPVAVTWHGQRWQVIQILNQWRSPSGKHFRVLTKGPVFTLSYHIVDDNWSIETNEDPGNSRFYTTINE